MFNSLKGERSNLAAVNVWHSPASFANCTFRALSEPTPPGPLEYGELVYGAINVAGLNATLALQNCTLESIRSSFAVSVQSTDVFTDNTTLTVTPPPQFSTDWQVGVTTKVVVVVGRCTWRWSLNFLWTDPCSTA